MKAYNIRAILLTAMLLCTVATSAQQWTLDQCIEYATSHNIDLRQKSVQIQKRGVSLNTSRNEWLPMVEGELAEQFSFGNYNSTTGSMNGNTNNQNNDLSYTTGKISATMNIFDGMKVKNSIIADRFSLEAATADLENARKDIGIQIAIQYLQCLYQRSMILEAQEQVSLSQQMVNRTQIRFDEGKRPLSELKDMEAQAANDEYTLVNARGQYTLALTKLSQLLNLPSTEGFDIADINEENEAPAVNYNQVLNNWPSIISAKAQIESSKAKVKIARADYYPTLSIQSHVSTFYVNFFHHDMGWGGFGKQFFDKNLNEVVGLHLKVPIFNRFQTRNKIRNAKLDILDQDLALEDAQQKLRHDIQTAETNVNVARQKSEAAQKSADAAAVSLSYEQERFDAGKSSVFDLLQARQKHMKSRQEAIQAKYELMIRQRILKFYDTL